MIPVPFAAILITIIVWGSTTIGASFMAYSAGGKAEKASQLREDAAAAKTRETAALAAAEAISRIEVTNTTIRQRVEAVTHEKIVYRDCRHADEQLRDINQALTGIAPADRKLPAVDPAR